MAEEKRESEDKPVKERVFKPEVLGWVVILLILAAYFLWMTVEMGTAAVTGATPMIAFLGAAAVGIAAAGAAMFIGRRR